MLTRLRILILTLLAFSLSLAASAQTPTPSALTLASMTPANAMLYASVRTDAGFIETLDGLIGRISEPTTGFPMNNTIGSLLKSEDIRGWLGDSIAVFILSPTEEVTDSADLLGLLAELKDRDAAIAYLDENFGTPSMTLPNGYIGYRDSSGFNVVITENTLVAGQTSLNAVPLLRGETLMESPDFQQALSALPAGGDYPLLAYFNPHDALITAAPDLYAALGEIDAPAFAESVGVFAAGMRQLDGQSYAFDFTWSYGEGDMLTALNLPEITLPTPPQLNPDFLNVVPANAQIVLQGVGLWTQFDAATRTSGILINALRSRALVDEVLTQQYYVLSYPTGLWGSAFLDLMVRGSLDLTSDQLAAALDGDAAFAVRLSLLPNERTSKVSVEYGTWVASRDNGSADLLAGGTALLKMFGVPLTEQADSIGVELPADLTGEESDSQLIQPSSMVWLATDALTYIGSDSLTLENKETFVAVPRITERIEPIRPHLLDGATGFAWLDITGLAPLLKQADPSLKSASEAFDSLFISTRQNDDSMTARFAFTLK